MLQNLYLRYLDYQMDFYNKKSKWLCPQCKTKLIRDVNREYETLCDHVCEPNKKIYPLRPSWKCPNKICVNNSGKEYFFGIDGGKYGGNFIKPYSAIYSFDWKMDKQHAAEKTWWFRFFTFIDIKSKIQHYYWKKRRGYL